MMSVVGVVIVHMETSVVVLLQSDNVCAGHNQTPGPEGGKKSVDFGKNARQSLR